MPTTLIPQETRRPETARPDDDSQNGLRRWNLAEYHRLKQSGFFGKERSELLDGLIWHPEEAMPRRWSREEYYRLGEMGFFDDERVELLDGRIWRLPPQKTPHFTTVRRTSEALEEAFGEGYEIRAQGPLTLPDSSQPEPDVLVVPGTPDDYDDYHPLVTDVLLLVEVSDSTLAKDQGSKLIDYARAGIPEYWIVNLVHRQLEVYRQPSLEGIYAEKNVFRPGEIASPINFPGKTVRVADLLPLTKPKSNRKL